MNNTIAQATVVMAKCQHSKRPFGIRIEQRQDGDWYCTWAFKLSEKAAAHEGYNSGVSITGRVSLTDEYPGCPHCGAHTWFKCGSCGRLTCYSDESQSTKCSWCGHASEKMSTSTEFDLTGGDY